MLTPPDYAFFVTFQSDCFLYVRFNLRFTASHINGFFKDPPFTLFPRFEGCQFLNVFFKDLRALLAGLRVGLPAPVVQPDIEKLIAFCRTAHVEPGLKEPPGESLKTNAIRGPYDFEKTKTYARIFVDFLLAIVGERRFARDFVRGINVRWVDFRL